MSTNENDPTNKLNKLNERQDNHQKFNNETCGNTLGNISNHGLAAIKDQWVYYNRSLKSSGLYKARLNGSGETKLHDGISFFLNIIGDWVYYCNHDENNKLYKIRTDGSGKMMLASDSTLGLNVQNDWVYYINNSDEGKIYRIKIDGSEKTKICDIVTNCLSLEGCWLYFVGLDYETLKDSMYLKIYPNNHLSGKLCKIRIDGSDFCQLTEHSVNYMTLADGWIYYSNRSDDGKLYRTKIEGDITEKISEELVSWINISGDWIYFSPDSYPDKGIKKVKNNGSDLINLHNQQTIFINIIGDWIYSFGNDNSLPLYDTTCRIRLDGSGFSSIFDKQRSANHLKVRFDDGKAYVYRTLDRKIKLGSKVKVEGKKSELIGEVVEEKVKYNKNADAYYIEEVISY